MTYYEELGVSPTATTNEIKKAYHQISKLFHPDTQTDDNVRQIAEIQQKRLNSIVAVLTNPDERYLYDQSLLAAEPVFGAQLAPVDFAADAFVPAPRRSFRSTRGQNYIWVGLFAIPIVGSALFWWSAEHNIVGVPLSSGSLRVDTLPVESERPAAPAVTPPPVPQSAPQTAEASKPTLPDGKNSPSQDLLPPPAPLLPVSTRNSTPPAPKAPARQVVFVPASTVSQLPAHLTQVTSAPVLNPPVVGSTLPPPPGISLPSVAPVLDRSPSVPASSGQTAVVASAATRTIAAAPAPPTSVNNPGLGGMWIFIPNSNGKSSGQSVYPPEFIELAVQQNKGRVQGMYRSRYRITDQPVSPEINFQFQGSEHGPQEFNWKLNDGTKGHVHLQQLTVNTMQVDWFVTQFGKAPGLASGSAVLTRRP